MNDQRLRYIPALDGLRAIGVILVMIHHFATPVPFGGFLGVDVFFVLSGYLIGSLLDIEYSTSGAIQLSRFYLRRLIRLYPALLSMLVVCFIPGLLLTHGSRAFILETLFAASYLTPFTITFLGIGWPLRHTWSLGIEQLFYLLWPVVLGELLRRTPSRRSLAAGIAALALLCGVAQIGYQHQFAEMTYFLRASGILFGCAVALVARAGYGPRVGRRLALLSFAVLALSVWLASNYAYEAYAVLVVDVCTSLIILHAIAEPQSPLVQVLSLRPMVYIGLISYELYLWHFPILTYAAWLLQRPYVEVYWIVVVPIIMLSALTHRLLSPTQANLRRYADHRINSMTRGT